MEAKEWQRNHPNAFMEHNFMEVAELTPDRAVTSLTTPATAIRMAVVVLGVLPILCAYPFFQNNFVKGMNLGAVKG